MLNLLFISDSPKAEYIKSELQPVLKVKIDVVTDFDHGLKDVFEKRPTTVCIQDQIGGVTGDSVARHIQMLLGTSAPSFILLHSGNDKARVINGLYEYLVDLSQPDDVLAENIQSTLKSLLGEQWEKVYIPPKQTSSSIMSSRVVSNQSNADADKLVDDFLSDLETSGFSVENDHPHAFKDSPDLVLSEQSLPDEQMVSSEEPVNTKEIVEPVNIQTNSDEMAELLLAEVNRAVLDENQVKASARKKEEPEVVFNVVPKPVLAAPSPSPAVVEPELSSGVSNPEKAAVVINRSKKEYRPSLAPEVKPQTPPAAEFMISKDDTPPDERIPEDLLLAFEENYRSESLFLRRSVIVAVVCLVCLAGVWYLINQNPRLVSSLRQRLLPSKAEDQILQPNIATQQKTPPPAVQSVKAPSLPSFIPKEGHDTTYAAKNPGWERYLSNDSEFRVFSASGRIKAVQVLGKEAPVTDSLIKSVLNELAGNSNYRIISRDSKAGLLVETGVIQDKGDIIIYRTNGEVKAFVVSVN